MSFKRKLNSLIVDPDVAIDLGTANTRLYAQGRGLVCDEPSVVSGQRRHEPSRSGNFVTGCALCVLPVRGGVVAEVVAAASLLRPLLRRARKFGLRTPRVLACAPSNATEADFAALVAGVRLAGISEVQVLPEPLAAAIGAGLDVSSSCSQMIVDIGDGVTDIAVIRSGSLVKTSALRLGCGDMHAAVRANVAKRHGIVLYDEEAARLTREFGCAYLDTALGTASALGIDKGRGREARAEVSGEEVFEAIQPVIGVIGEAVRGSLRSLPLSLAAEVIESGICLTGGGACLRGMDAVIADETSVEVKVSQAPLHAVINGAGQMLAVGTDTDLWHTSISPHADLGLFYDHLSKSRCQPSGLPAGK